VGFFVEGISIGFIFITMKTTLILLTIVSSLLVGCLQSTSKSNDIDEKNALIAKYGGKIPVNNWEPADKKRFLELIK
jgi:hypothetical protein